MAQVLIVDDEKSIRRTLGEFLRDAGYDVVEAEDADAALAQLQAGTFDVVVTDIILPRVTGVELLRLIHGVAPQVQVVMMTGEPTVETATEALRLGAADYLFKPINKAAILRAAANATRIKVLEDMRRRLEAQNQAHRENLERTVAERTAQLQASERRYRNLVETAFDWVWEIDAQGRYTYASPRVFNLLGYPPEEVIGLTPFDLMPETEAQRVRCIFDPIVAKREPFAMLENINRHRDGRLVVLESSGAPVLSRSGEFLGYRGMDRDITERRAAEEQLRKLARAVAQSPASILITDRNGNIEFVNPKFTQVTGYSADEVRGKNPRVLKSGETSADEYRRLWQTILAGREWRGEFHNKRKDGTYFWEAASISAVRDPAGQITHFIAVKEDVTEKKQLEARFLRAQRVESIGSLASGIAHDLNNILAPILMCAPMLELDDSPGNRREIAETIKFSAQRAAGIVQQLLTFARGKEGQKQPVQVRYLMREMAKIARETFPRTIQVQECCDPGLWPVIGDATQLHQVLLNLCVNARDAMPAGGRLTLRADNMILDELFVGMRPEACHGPYVRIQVQDTGTGIPESAQSHIFESFFTTKGEGEGTGLGLTTAQGIVKDHGGFITFATAAGKGTSFDVHLPATLESEPGADEPSASGEVPRGQGELILMVDDEPVIRDTARRTLERMGYRVLQAQNGIEALAQFSQHPREVRAVITDFMMPLMDGVTLCRTLRTLSPGTPLIVSSGGLLGKTGEEALRAFGELGMRHILHKPHGADVLLRTLATALRGGSPDSLKP